MAVQTEQPPKTVEELLRQHNEKKTRLGLLKCELEVLNKTGKSPAGDTGRDREKIEEEIYLLGMRIKIVDDAVASLPELQRRVIERHIIDGEPYYKVCAEMYMGERGVRNLKKRALQILERIIPIGGEEQ